MNRLKKRKREKSTGKIIAETIEIRSLKIPFARRKIKRRICMVHTHGRGDNAWLLIKHRDEYAKTSDITKKEKSVVSGKTIKQVEKTPENIYGQAKSRRACSQKKTCCKKNS
jgi:bifunctional non-homologous end joining protein LigD